MEDYESKKSISDKNDNNLKKDISKEKCGGIEDPELNRKSNNNIIVKKVKKTGEKNSIFCPQKMEVDNINKDIESKSAKKASIWEVSNTRAFQAW